MVELYRVMVHNPDDIGWKDDSFLENWDTWRVNVEKDGDVITLTVQAGYSYGYIWKSINVDASTHQYLIVCLKGDGEYRIRIYDGDYKTVQDWTQAPSGYEVKVYDLSSITTGTITQIFLEVGREAGKKAYYDFAVFTKRPPQFLQDVTEVRVHQRESDLDTFEIVKDNKPLFEDHFGDNLGKWEPSGGTWQIESGELSGETNGFGQRIMIKNLAVEDFVAEYKVKWVSGSWFEHGLIFRAGSNPPNNCYMVFMSKWNNTLRLCKRVGGGSIEIATVSFTPQTGKWYKIKIAALGRNIRVWLDGSLKIDAYDNSFSSGNVGFMSWSGASEHAHYDDLVIMKTMVNLGDHIWIWLKGVKVFAGIIETKTPLEDGTLQISGRCFGQKLLLKTKTISWSGREVSQAVKDLVADISEITTYGVETPSPTVYITKDLKHEYITDALKDLAQHIGSDWEWKLSYGQDLRFRSRNSPNVPTAPITLQEGVNVLKGVRKESDALHLYNKVVVIGGTNSLMSQHEDGWTDVGDSGDWTTYPTVGINVGEDGTKRMGGECSIYAELNTEQIEWTIERSLEGPHDLTKYNKMIFWVSGVLSPEPLSFQLRLGPNSSTYYSYSLDTSDLTKDTWKRYEIDLDDWLGDWSERDNINWIQFRFYYGSSTMWTGRFYIDGLHFYRTQIKRTAIDNASPIKHTREYIYINEKITDWDFAGELANALLQTLKEKADRYRIPTYGTPDLQPGTKVSVHIPSQGLSGTYYIAEAEHRLTHGSGLITEVVLEKPTRTLETILAETIARRIRVIERGGLS
ncbi:hypothetical protein DRO55_05365 [Candidatus Bathyarchaeota archaeon]|nr:MAG: hypothetical protein DRO55_05365 [Candidatus Bathyarchaeota archaeon]